MKLTADRPYADPEKDARRIPEIAKAVEPLQGRIHIEKINEPFLFRDRGRPRVRRGPQTRDRARLAQDARIRDFRNLHARRCRAVRVSIYLASGSRLLIVNGLFGLRNVTPTIALATITVRYRGNYR